MWIPAIQQGIWPNLAARNTMFGGEDLADVMLYGGLSDDSGEHGDNKLESVLYAEQKSLLVALTRASEQVTASAVYNDDLTPSDFLYGYIPERFNRERHASAEGREYTQVGEAGRSKVWTPILAPGRRRPRGARRTPTRFQGISRCRGCAATAGKQWCRSR